MARLQRWRCTQLAVAIGILCSFASAFQTNPSVAFHAARAADALATPRANVRREEHDVEAVVVVDDADDVANPFHRTGVHAVQHAVEQAAGRRKVDGVVQKGGHSTRYVNVVLCVMVLTMAVVISLGWLVDRFCNSRSQSKRHVSAMEIAMMAASYGPLVPGIASTLFSFDIVITVLGLPISVTMDPATGQGAPITPSVMTLVRVLLETGSIVGAFLLVFYALVVPVLKLFLLSVGEFFRHSENPEHVRTARRCIAFVQVVSKWAAPDMFAYMLILYIFRALDDPNPPAIMAVGHLDVGFVCFSLFCVSSTLSSLFIQSVDEPEDGTTSKQPRELPWICAEGRVACTTTFLGIGFGVLLILGLCAPCLSLRLDTERMLQNFDPVGIVPQVIRPFVKPIIDKIVRSIAESLDSKVRAEVSIWQCLVALLGWAGRGEASCGMAFVMLAVFAIGLSVLDMVILVVLAYEVQRDGGNDAQFKGVYKRLLDFSRALRHVAMLDVCVMGILVVAWAGHIYKDVGVIWSLCRGLYALLGAASLHHAAHWVLECVVSA